MPEELPTPDKNLKELEKDYKKLETKKFEQYDIIQIVVK